VVFAIDDHDDDIDDIRGRRRSVIETNIAGNCVDGVTKDDIFVKPCLHFCVSNISYPGYMYFKQKFHL